MKKLLLTSAVALSVLCQINPLLGSNYDAELNNNNNNTIAQNKQYTELQQNWSIDTTIGNEIAACKKRLPDAFQSAWESYANNEVKAFNFEDIKERVTKAQEAYSGDGDELKAAHEDELATARADFEKEKLLLETLSKFPSVAAKKGNALALAQKNYDEKVMSLEGQYESATADFHRRSAQALSNIQKDGELVVYQVLQKMFADFLARNNVNVPLEKASPAGVLKTSGSDTPEIELEKMLPSYGPNDILYGFIVSDFIPDTYTESAFDPTRPIANIFEDLQVDVGEDGRMENVLKQVWGALEDKLARYNKNTQGQWSLENGVPFMFSAPRSSEPYPPSNSDANRTVPMTANRTVLMTASGSDTPELELEDILPSNAQKNRDNRL